MFVLSFVLFLCVVVVFTVFCVFCRCFLHFLEHRVISVWGTAQARLRHIFGKLDQGLRLFCCCFMTENSTFVGRRSLSRCESAWIPAFAGRRIRHWARVVVFARRGRSDIGAKKCQTYSSYWSSFVGLSLRERGVSGSLCETSFARRRKIFPVLEGSVFDLTWQVDFSGFRWAKTREQSCILGIFGHFS